MTSHKIPSDGFLPLRINSAYVLLKVLGDLTVATSSAPNPIPSPCLLVPRAPKYASTSGPRQFAVPTVMGLAPSCPSHFTVLQGAVMGQIIVLAAHLFKVCFLSIEDLFCFLLYPQGPDCRLTASGNRSASRSGNSPLQKPSTKSDEFIKNHHFRTLGNGQGQAAT